MTKETTIKATVTEYVWTNPHVELGISLSGGTTTELLLELGSPPKHQESRVDEPRSQGRRCRDGHVPSRPARREDRRRHQAGHGRGQELHA